MCNRYVSPDNAELERVWQVGARDHWRGGSVFPRKLGPFVRAGAAGERELVVAQWGLIPLFAKTVRLPYQTKNARSEELAAKATFREPWKLGQRCLIPVIWFDEPSWESGARTVSDQLTTPLAAMPMAGLEPLRPL